MKTKAVILAQDRYDSFYGKTAHGLVKFSNRYEIAGVIDSTQVGRDAGEVLDGIHRGIPFFSSLGQALDTTPGIKTLIIGVANAGGRLPRDYYPLICGAILKGMDIVNGLHMFLSDDPEIAELAFRYGVQLIDVRKIFNNLRVSFSGKIRDVTAKKVAVIGTDGIIGKRTTALTSSSALKKERSKPRLWPWARPAGCRGLSTPLSLTPLCLIF